MRLSQNAKRYFSLFLLLLSTSTYGHNKVVVIPLGASEGLSNVITVAEKGGDFISVEAALESINDASEGSPYLILVAPGTFFVTRQLELKPFVSIAGSGQETTTLVSHIRDSVEPMIIGNTNTTLSDLTILSTNTPSFPSETVYQCPLRGPDCFNSKVENITIKLIGNTARELVAFIVDEGSLTLESSQIFTNNNIGKAIGFKLDFGSVTVNDSFIQSNSGEAIIFGTDSAMIISKSELSHRANSSAMITVQGIGANLFIRQSLIRSRTNKSSPINISTQFSSGLRLIVGISHSSFLINNSQEPISISNENFDSADVSCIFTDAGALARPLALNSDCSRPTADVN